MASRSELLLRGAVLMGAQLLSRKGPPDWDAKVDSDRLNMADPKLDILGQLYGSYSVGMEALFGALKPMDELSKAVAHGFERDESTTYAALTAEWARAIKVRRASGPDGS